MASCQLGEYRAKVMDLLRSKEPRNGIGINEVTVRGHKSVPFA
jgi:hypothetical protein